MLMLAPAGSGTARFMLVAESDELNPPPFGCEGGCSSVVPITGAAEPSVRETIIVEDVRGRRSAIPPGAGNVSISATRNRSLVTAAPVLLVQVRLTESVPNVELFAGSEVKSRATFGETLSACAGSNREWASPDPSSTGLERFSGPGAPSRCPAPADVPFVSTKTKSRALSLVSCGMPESPGEQTGSAPATLTEQ